MKVIDKNIVDFINAYDLERPAQAVCFAATVFAFSANNHLHLESEIHIISIEAKELDMVYVLNPELKSKGFPDSFEIGKVEASFKQKKGLLISGSGPDCGEYSILIQPTGKDCEEPDISAYYSGKSLFEKLPG